MLHHHATSSPLLLPPSLPLRIPNLSTGLRLPSKSQFFTNLARRNALVSYTIRAANKPSPPSKLPPSSDKNYRNKLFFISSGLTFLFAVANRVLHKLALVPMKDHPIFLSQLTAFGYVVIYFSTLYARYSLGIVTKEMIGLPKSRFLFIGLLEALGSVALMSASAKLPGPAIPILSQTMLVWQLILSSLILGRRHSFNQKMGCVLVAVGLVVAVASGSNADHMLSGVEPIWPVVMIVSSVFQAGASIIKESVFEDAKKQLKGKSLDIFVVNSFGSGFQALFGLLLLPLPLLSNLRGIPIAQLPSYLKSGAGCFLNTGANTAGCDGAPFLPLLYIIINVAFNISWLNLVKMSSAVDASLAVTPAVPLSIYVLSLPLPYLPDGAKLSPFFLLGSAILVSGLILYNVVQPAKQASA